MIHRHMSSLSQAFVDMSLHRASSTTTTPTKITTRTGCRNIANRIGCRRHAVPSSIGLVLIVLVAVSGMCPVARAQDSEERFLGDECTLSDGSRGVCRISTGCDWLVRKLKQNEIRHAEIVRCAFEGGQLVVCCADEHVAINPMTMMPKPNNPTEDPRRPITESPPSVPPTVTPRSVQQRPSQVACARYMEYTNNVITYHILGGTVAENGEYPHMAAIGYASTETSLEYAYDCGGTIIAERWILTAAHCLRADRPPLVVLVGKLSLYTEQDGLRGVLVNVAEIVRHPDYVSSRNYDDIGLLRLADAMLFDSNIHPACLYTDVMDVSAEQKLYVSGWGDANATDTYQIDAYKRTKVLMSANLTGTDLSACNASIVGYRNVPWGRLLHGLTRGHICAGDPSASHDACRGDSGGPLQIVDEENRMSTVVGVISFGLTCGSIVPSVYSRVAHYLEWIESHVWP